MWLVLENDPENQFLFWKHLLERPKQSIPNDEKSSVVFVKGVEITA